MSTRENENVGQLLIKKAESVELASLAISDKTKDWQVIRNFLFNRIENIKLNAAQEKKLERYQFIYSQTCSGKYTDSEVINAVMKNYDIKSKPQAYEDLRCARELFLDTMPLMKRFEIHVQLQVNRNMQRKAEEINDMRAAALFEKNRIALLALLPEEEENPEIFEGHVVEAKFDPRLLGPGREKIDMKALLEAINAKRDVKIKTDMFQELEIEDEQRDPL